MDKLFSVFKILGKHSPKIAYALALLAIGELGYIYLDAIKDGQIDQQEQTRLNDAVTRVVDSLAG